MIRIFLKIVDTPHVKLAFPDAKTVRHATNPSICQRHLQTSPWSIKCLTRSLRVAVAKFYQFANFRVTWIVVRVSSSLTSHRYPEWLFPKKMIKLARIFLLSSVHFVRQKIYWGKIWKDILGVNTDIALEFVQSAYKKFTETPTTYLEIFWAILSWGTSVILENCMTGTKLKSNSFNESWKKVWWANRRLNFRKSNAKFVLLKTQVELNYVRCVRVSFECIKQKHMT